MSTYELAISADGKTAYLTFGADSPPGGSVSLGTFDHNESDDPVHPHAGNHALFHHVRDILNKREAGSPADNAMFPYNITNMQAISIVRHGPAMNAEYLTAADVTAADPGTVAAVVKYQPANVNANNNDFNWVSSDPTKATVSAAGVVTGVANGTSTITATHKHSGLSVSFVMTTT
ncbi:Ig-like domain-containing protein [Mesorhizobium yinganensis]|uniref:Ig-like domain-containing protein n=1 Tax=Mesorhizobium yinganensis TaxID=3157707 RepID=UPI0032B7B017